MRIPSLLLLATLAACTRAEPPVTGAWEIVEAAGVPSQTLASGRTLQLLDGGQAVVSGPGFETRHLRYQLFRGQDIVGDDRPMLLFEGAASPFVITMPTRNELSLEENSLEATLLKLRRAR